MTTPDIAGLCERLRAALEGVTPGPWAIDRTSERHGQRPYGICAGNPGLMRRNIVNWGGIASPASDESEANARFIALSREAVPALLDTLERQAAEMERLRGALQNIQIEAEREDGRWVHLKRVIAINARAALTEEDARPTRSAPHLAVVPTRDENAVPIALGDWTPDTTTATLTGEDA